ncbi:MAG: hypothetical protein ACE5HA_00125 [Anaerolineae bacterium]
MRLVARGVVAFSVMLLLMLPTAVAQAGAPPALDQARGGTIVGNSGGAFDYYVLEHPGAGRAVKLRMDFAPWHINREQGIGFNLYDEKGRRVGRGMKVDPHAVELAFTLTTDFPTRYLIQVHNYYQGFVMSYSLVPEGLADAEVGSPATGGTAQQPGLLVDLAEGSVPGLRHGSFDYYQFYHPGGKPIWIKMVYQPDHWIIAPGVGFNAYLGHWLAAQGKSDGVAKNMRWVKLAPAEPTTYLIQVYNYIPEILLTYQLAVTE